MPTLEKSVAYRRTWRGKVEELSNGYGQFRADMVSLRQTVEALDHRLSAGIDALDQRLSKRIDALGERFFRTACDPQALRAHRVPVPGTGSRFTGTEPLRGPERNVPC